jgi:hypothetical protein
MALLLGTSSAIAEDSVLPQGDSKAALSSAHFPDRVHEFVWRNWEAVPPARIAQILGASIDQVTGLATAMGLPANPVVSPDIRERGYVTLIRRNWHLLPYSQLLQLLDMTPESLSVMLREEDFLWIKLGQIKPQCDPLQYVEPNETARQREAEIRRVVEQDFGAALTAPGEPRFDFVRQLATPLPSYTPPAADPNQSLRIVYSYVAVYGDPLLNTNLNPYPDGLLERLSDSGVNGVWLQAVLRDLAPGGEAFPEFGEGHEQRLANLRTLVERARKHGIGVYLYINEPRAMPEPFFANRPELAGVKEGPLAAMCTSQPAVRQWMADALAHIFREVPGLGGVYTITASENLTNCASHGGNLACARCKDRSDTDIITEVVSTIEEGVHRGNPDAKVLISDWGWRGHGDARELITRLSGKPICLMSVSEWNLPIERGGIQSTVGEYSISSVGPGPRALPHWQTARDAGLKTGAEIQFNNTCEIATLPYIPVLDLVAEHYGKLLAAARPDAMLIGWTMGGYPSPNLRLVRMMSATPAPEPASVLDALALERYGAEGASHGRKAWTLMSEAYREYPFHISVVYTSPVQCGPANLLYATKTGYKATMWGLPYDDVDTWRGPYPPEVLAAQFQKIVDGWRPALTELHAAAEKAPAEQRAQAESDLRMARAGAIHFESVANQTRFITARDANAKEELRRCLESEIALARELYTLSRQDSRIGFEPSCQYFYFPLDLVEKVINCRALLNHYKE